MSSRERDRYSSRYAKLCQRKVILFSPHVMHGRYLLIADTRRRALGERDVVVISPRRRVVLFLDEPPARPITFGVRECGLVAEIPDRGTGDHRLVLVH